MLSFRTIGRPSSRPLIFLHGFLGSSLDFLPVLLRLRQQFFCIAVDLPGHGKSPYMQDVVKAVEKTVLSLSCRPNLIGYSLGGRIALMLKQRIPDLPPCLLLSSHPGLRNEEEKAERKKRDALMAERLRTLPCKDFLRSWYQQSVFASLQRNPRLLADLLQRRQYANKEELASILEELSLGNQSFFLPRNALFVSGSEDPAYGNLYRSLPIETVTVRKSGHILPIEAPERTARIIETFFRDRKTR